LDGFYRLSPKHQDLKIALFKVVDSNIPPDIATPCPKYGGSGWSN